MVYFLIFSDNFGRGHGYDVRRYNLEPFLEIKRFVKYRSYMSTTSVMLNLVGNVVAFMPFGMLIRWARNKKTGVLTAFVYSMLFSCIIEVAQLVTKLGVFDVDDIIMNTIGGMIGYLVYVILAVYDKRRRKHNEEQRIQSSTV
jgi:glycopeptide antibiotics resistance protein